MVDVEIRALLNRLSAWERWKGMSFTRRRNDMASVLKKAVAVHILNIKR